MSRAAMTLRDWNRQVLIYEKWSILDIERQRVEKRTSQFCLIQRTVRWRYHSIGMANYETQIFVGRFPGEKTRVPKKVALQLPLHCGGVYHQRRWLDVQINAVQKTKWDLQTPWCCFLSYDWNSIGKKPVSSQWLLESWKNHEQKPWIILADVKKTDKCVTISTVRGRHWLFFLIWTCSII